MSPKFSEATQQNSALHTFLVLNKNNWKRRFLTLFPAPNGHQNPWKLKDLNIDPPKTFNAQWSPKFSKVTPEPKTCRCQSVKLFCLAGYFEVGLPQANTWPEMVYRRVIFGHRLIVRMAFWRRWFVSLCNDYEQNSMDFQIFHIMCGKFP